MVAVYDDDELSAWRKAKGPEGFSSLAPGAQIDPASVSPVSHIAQNYVQPSVAHVHPWLQEVQTMTSTAMPSVIVAGEENTHGTKLPVVSSSMTLPEESKGQQQPLHPSQTEVRPDDSEQNDQSQLQHAQAPPEEPKIPLREEFSHVHGSPSKPEHRSLMREHPGSWNPPRPLASHPHHGHLGHPFSGPPRTLPPNTFNIADNGIRLGAVPYLQQHQQLHQSEIRPRPRDADHLEWNRSAFRAAGLPVSPEGGPNRHR